MFVAAAVCAALSYGYGVLVSADDLAIHFSEDEAGAAQYLKDWDAAQDVIDDDGEQSRDTRPSEWEVLGEVETWNKAQWQAMIFAVTRVGGDLRIGLFALIVAGTSTALFETGVLARVAGKWIHTAAILPVGVVFGLVASLAVGDGGFQSRVIFYGAIGFVSSLFALLRPVSPWRAAVVGSIGCAVIQSSMSDLEGSYLYRAHYGLLASVFTFIGNTTFAFCFLAPLAWFMLNLWPETKVPGSVEAAPIEGA